MEVANDGKAYYPSKIMPWHYKKGVKSPVDAFLDEAAKHNVKVFMSTGWAQNQDDNLQDPAIKKRQLQIRSSVGINSCGLFASAFSAGSRINRRR